MGFCLEVGDQVGGERLEGLAGVGEIGPVAAQVGQQREGVPLERRRDQSRRHPPSLRVSRRRPGHPPRGRNPPQGPARGTSPGSGCHRHPGPQSLRTNRGHRLPGFGYRTQAVRLRGTGAARARPCGRAGSSGRSKSPGSRDAFDATPPGRVRLQVLGLSQRHPSIGHRRSPGSTGQRHGPRQHPGPPPRRDTHDLGRVRGDLPRKRSGPGFAPRLDLLTPCDRRSADIGRAMSVFPARRRMLRHLPQAAQRGRLDRTVPAGFEIGCHRQQRYLPAPDRSAPRNLHCHNNGHGKGRLGRDHQVRGSRVPGGHLHGAALSGLRGPELARQRVGAARPRVRGSRRGGRLAHRHDVACGSAHHRDQVFSRPA